jgi:autotransporter translocation and assembly factor TamB
VTVHRAEYTKEFATGVNVFDFGQKPTLASGSTLLTPTLPLRYNVTITAGPSAIHANNNLLRDVTASGEVTLVGTFDQPGLLGNIDVNRGDVILRGKQYSIRQAAIQFNNPSAIEPFFDIEASTRQRVPGETYTVTIRASGPNPMENLQLTSEPPLPEIQLLALLISDVAPSRDVELAPYSGITPQDQLLRETLTQALTSAATSEISKGLQQALAVDSVNLTTRLVDPNQQSARLNPAARVTVLKRVGNRVFITYARSLSSSTRDQVIVIEIDQTDRLSWILSRNEDGTYALDLTMRGTF